MKHNVIRLGLTFLLLTLPLAGCRKTEAEKVITVAASQLPHAKILNEAVRPLLAKDGYTLETTVLEWSQMNSAVARKEYDANYFQHLPFLENYNASVSDEEQLTMVCKVHFEKLCLYARDIQGHPSVQDGDRIEIVNDVSNIERALLLLKSKGILSAIHDSCYKDGIFTTFDTSDPNAEVDFAPDYTHVRLTCIQESQLPTSLGDYDFGVIPGNTALTGLGADYAKRIVSSEDVDDKTVSLRANGIAVRKCEEKSAKAQELVKVFADASVKDYVDKTFGDSVLYFYQDLTK